ESTSTVTTSTGSAEERATTTSNRPASTSQSCASTSHTANERRVRGISTVSLWPGSRCTFANPASSLSGRGTLDSTSRTYTCTTSEPRRSPVLVTRARTVSSVPCPSTSMSDQSKVVYDSPNPKGKWAGTPAVSWKR